MIKRDLYEAQTVLHNIYNDDSGEVGLYFTLLPLFREINNHISDIQKAKEVILNDCAKKNEDGKLEKEVVDGLSKFVLNEDKVDEFSDRFNKILEEEVTMSGALPRQLAKDLHMSIAELTTIEFLFEK